MNGFYYRLRQFMNGRAGVDTLSVVLVIVAMAVSFIMTLFRLSAFAWQRIFVYLLLGVAVYRILSKNITRRARENDAFMSFVNKFRKNKNGNYKNTAYQTHFKSEKPKPDKKNYKYFKCPNCKAKLRVPRGKGKINVSCPKCRAKFQKKS